MTSSQPPITRATTGDVAALAPLFDAYRVFYGFPSTPKVAEDFLRDRLEAGESVVFFWRDGPSGPLAGFVQLYPSFSSLSADRLWILNDLYVAPEARRRGVARALLAAAHDFARSTGASQVVLATAQSNHAAQALYESMGYVEDAEFRSYTLALRAAG